MRYVAKIHVLDIMDDVVVSGYVYDAEPLSGGDHEPFEFSWVTPGRGLDDPVSWLLVHLYQALQQGLTPVGNRTDGGQVMGGPHTLSEVGDSA